MYVCVLVCVGVSSAHFKHFPFQRSQPASYREVPFHRNIECDFASVCVDTRDAGSGTIYPASDACSLNMWTFGDLLISVSASLHAGIDSGNMMELVRSSNLVCWPDLLVFDLASVMMMYKYRKRCRTGHLQGDRVFLNLSFAVNARCRWLYIADTLDVEFRETDSIEWVGVGHQVVSKSINCSVKSWIWCCACKNADRVSRMLNGKSNVVGISEVSDVFDWSLQH